MAYSHFSCFLPKIFLPFFSVTIFVFYNNLCLVSSPLESKGHIYLWQGGKTTLILDIICDV